MHYYVTAERLEKLKIELRELKTVNRLEVAKRLERAKELGDLSENSEYIEAREEQAQIERRIFMLEQMLKNALIIKKPDVNTGKVQIGSTVEVERNEKIQRFTIVGSSETRPEEGLISNESPLGKALLGRAEGETVTAKVPSGELDYRIVKIE